MTKNTVEITNAIVVRNPHSTDTIYLKTTWPDTTHASKDSATVTLCVPNNSAEKFLAEHLPGVPFETVMMRGMCM